MFLPLFFLDGALCFFPFFGVFFLADGVSVCACTHVRMYSLWFFVGIMTIPQINNVVAGIIVPIF